MKFKNTFKKSVLNTTKDSSLEELLLSIEESNIDKENLDFKQYNKNIVNAASNTLLNKTLTIEDRKNISLNNSKKVKKQKTLFKSSKYISHLMPVHFILLVTIVYPFIKTTLNQSIDIANKISSLSTNGVDITTKTHITQEVINSLNDLLFNYQIIISFFMLPIIIGTISGGLWLLARLLKHSTLKKTKKEYQLNNFFENVKDNVLKEINLIENPKLLNIKEQMLNYVNDKKNKKYLFKNINEKLENHVVGNEILGIENKLIKQDKDSQ